MMKNERIAKLDNINFWITDDAALLTNNQIALSHNVMLNNNDIIAVLMANDMNADNFIENGQHGLIGRELLPPDHDESKEGLRRRADQMLEEEINPRGPR